MPLLKKAERYVTGPVVTLCSYSEVIDSAVQQLDRDLLLGYFALLSPIGTGEPMFEPLQKLSTPAHRFTLLTNHAHVLVLIAQWPDVRMREIASRVGITERAVQRIVDDLTTSGFILVTKNGRRNRYELRPDHAQLHPVEQHCKVLDLVRFMLPAAAIL